MTSSQGLLWGRYDGLLCDLDGVVYAGPEPIEDAPQSLQALHSLGVKIGYVTNNASRSNTAVAEHLSELGAPAVAETVYGSVQAAVQLLQEKLAAPAKVLATGSPFLKDSLVAAGYLVVESYKDVPAAVVQGFNPRLGWTDLAQASYAITAGAFWVATNLDATIPTAEGIAPGNGSLVQAVATATQKTPVVAGKPEPHLFRAAAQALGMNRPLVLGDRLDTDIVGGNRAGFDTCLVLTGINSAEDAATADEAYKPTHIISTLKELL